MVQGQIALSVVLPAYNEEANIATTVRKLRLAVGGFETEIIVVDDGSTDATRRETLKLDVRLLSLSKNQGKGEAVRRGMMQATGSVVGLIDGDSEIDPASLASFVNALENADIAIGSKRHPQSCVQAPFQRRFLSYGFQTLVRILMGLKVSDTQTGLKVGRREAIVKILPLLSVKRYAFDVEFLVAAEILGLRIVELPVNLKLEATFKTKDWARMLYDLLGITYRLRVTRWYSKKIALIQP